ncbi:MAG: DUF6580 family putative transport protein [Bacteroidota bacterium]
MKIDKSIIISFVLLVLIASLYRIMPGRPLGFAPQIAMALFAGSIVKDKKFAFILPLFSMFISDLTYEVLYSFNISSVPGFYDGQLLNYVLIGAVTFIGFAINRKKIAQIVAGSFAGAIAYFFVSNLAVWMGGGLALNNLPYPTTMEGLLSCLTAGLPFLKGSLYATLFFSAVLFGGYYLLEKSGYRKPVLAKA